jgi:hypothetical protein
MMRYRPNIINSISVWYLIYSDPIYQWSAFLIPHLWMYDIGHL